MLIWHERPSFWALGMHWRTKQSPQCQGTYACWGTILNRLVGEGLFEMTFKKYSNKTSKTSIIQYNLKGPHTSYRAGILKLWDLRPADLRWSWCDNNRNKMHKKYNELESPQNHPQPTPLSVCAKIVFHKTSLCCQKGWGPLLEGKWTLWKSFIKYVL